MKNRHRLQLLSAVLLLCAGALAQARSQPVRGSITYVTTDAAYLDLGSERGLQPGSRLVVKVDRKKVASLEVLEVSPHSAVARVLDQKRPLRPGMPVSFRSTAVAEAASQPATSLRASASGTWVHDAGTFSKVGFAGQRAIVTWTPLRNSAHLRSATWIAFGSANGITQREQLDLAVQGPLDTAGRWQLDVLASAAGQPVSPAQGRFRQGSWGWLEVNRATLAYRPIDALSVQLGRHAETGLRYGLVDAAGVTWHASEDGPHLHLVAGLQPTRTDLVPSLQRPLAALGVDGGAHWGWASLRYQGDLSSLWDIGRGSDGGEASLSLDLDGDAGWHLSTDLGTVLVVDDGKGRPALVPDRAVLSASWRLGAVQLGANARRLDHRLLWPDNLMGAWQLTPDAAFYDGGLALDAGGRLGALYAGASLAGGGGVSEDGSWPRAWVMPSLWTRLPWWSSSLQLLYRGEWSPVGSHLVSATLGTQPVDGLRLGLSQSGGVYLLDQSRQILATGTTGLRGSFRFLGKGEVGLRADLRYGDLAGLELWAWAAAIDLL
ncbi:MAG: hypothetical protein ABIJ09_16285 [Pseudomonadota bacterium]